MFERSEEGGISVDTATRPHHLRPKTVAAWPRATIRGILYVFATFVLRRLGRGNLSKASQHEEPPKATPWP